MTIQRIGVLPLAGSLGCCSDVGSAPSESYDADIILELIFSNLMTSLLPQHRGELDFYALSVIRYTSPLSDPSQTVLGKALPGGAEGSAPDKCDTANEGLTHRSIL